MPSVTAHQEQYEENKTVLEQLDMIPISNKWKVTVSFYAALHLVEKQLAEYNQHFKEHKTRNKFIESQKMFEPIREAYDALYIESKRARYTCLKIHDKNVTDAKLYLTTIEDHINKPE